MATPKDEGPRGREKANDALAVVVCFLTVFAFAIRLVDRRIEHTYSYVIVFTPIVCMLWRAHRARWVVVALAGLAMHVVLRVRAGDLLKLMPYDAAVFAVILVLARVYVARLGRR
jgi:hypothetical protein